MKKHKTLKNTILYSSIAFSLALTPNTLCAKSETDSISFSNTIRIWKSDSPEVLMQKATHVVPTERQLEALRNEFIAFIHLGPNTFTQREWGTGEEDPKIFNPKTIDTDQWCKALKDAGMKMVVLTTKHHDGFVLWQTRYTKHGIMSSPINNGQADIMKSLSASCKKYGLKLGIYLSPADLYQMRDGGLYGNLSEKTLRTIPRKVEGRPFANPTTFQFKVDDYNEYFLNQLFELLTEYGEISEVWFDGAHPKSKGGQTYDYLAWKKLIRTLAPNAVIFGREDVRWGGNEAGDTRETEWNVMPYAENPNEMTRFHDLMGQDLGSRDKLKEGNYLHYQQSEMDTSIREGWFYRDDTKQSVRSTDNVFDMYERVIGGNATLILNIPPNREGKFSDRDVKVLQETGKRIRETYAENLLKKAVNAPKELLDGDDQTSVEYLSPIEITLPSAIKVNRIMLQEPVAKTGERVEKHAIDVWTNNEWKEVAVGTNIGYKRILRFDDVTTNKIRLRILETRATPYISSISAHYYVQRPPMLSITKDINGLVHITPLKHQFKWHGKQAETQLKDESYTIYYTTDGSTPTRKSKVYTSPFAQKACVVKAVAYQNNMMGAVANEQIGHKKYTWKVEKASSEQSNHEAIKAIDANPSTYWITQAGQNHELVISLNGEQIISGLAYTPQTEHAEGMIEQMEVYAKKDNGQWKKIETIEFGNLINSPNKRFHYFKKAFKANGIMLKATRIAGNNDKASIAELDLF